MQGSSEQFPVVRWRDGYDISEVDRFVSWLEDALSAADASPEVACVIREVRFTPRAFRRSYDIAAVDEFLDEQVAMAEARAR